MPETVWLAGLALVNFRNIAALSLDLDRRHVVLVGPNGAGKTNILEAVSLLSPGRGMRRSHYQHMARQAGDGSWSVSARIGSGDEETRIGTGFGTIGPGQWQRQSRVDGTSLQRSEDLLVHIRVIWLLPSMDGLFAGPAGDRRRFVDRMVLALDSGHGRRVAAYERAMRGRNRLLTQGRRDPAWLASIEDQLATLGLAIARARAALVARLQTTIAALPAADGAFPRAQMTLVGDWVLGEGAAGVDYEDRLRRELQDGRHRDQAAGRTLAGPHRDDLQVNHGDHGRAAAFCSTGEQKALLIGVILAHAQLTGETSSQAPLLLLDEVAAHLDAGRRAGLFDRLDDLGCQAWLTGTERTPFSALEHRAQVLEVADGQVNPSPAAP